MGFAVPAMADEVNQIAIYGEVSPRCWVVDPMKVNATNSAVQAAPARAICNQARPVLASEVRMIGSDGILMKRLPAATDRAESGRASCRERGGQYVLTAVDAVS